MADQTSPTTTRDLVKVIQTVKPESKPLPGYEGQHHTRMFVGVCMDECYPGLYIGDMGAATNKEYLKHVGITHVLNTAQGNKITTVNTKASFYEDSGIKYKGIQLLDVPSANIKQYFDEGAEFINDALESGGRILVHCFMGISRSATIACAFLMLKRNMTAVEALTTLRKNRQVYPNDGFLSQLSELDNSLQKRGKL
ncbi:dual specificity protein phosphatase 3-like isoform X3 [Oratosquilla oratoria]|uniref:dual specificity protein phosphatase 3-like isoform X3 n=1 Tax=Oratosquilla oratoria TaxID=337810 RepID=UPI003F7735A9